MRNRCQIQFFSSLLAARPFQFAPQKNSSAFAATSKRPLPREGVRNGSCSSLWDPWSSKTRAEISICLRRRTLRRLCRSWNHVRQSRLQKPRPCLHGCYRRRKVQERRTHFSVAASSSQESHLGRRRQVSLRNQRLKVAHCLLTRRRRDRARKTGVTFQVPELAEPTQDRLATRAE